MKKLTVLMAAALLSGSFIMSCQSKNEQPQEKSSVKEQVQQTIETAKENTTEVAETVKEKAPEVKQKAQETTESAKEEISKTSETVKEKSPEVKQKVEETAETAKEKTQEVVETAKEKVASAKETVSQKVKTFVPTKKLDGEQLFKQKTCSGCHQPKIDMTGPSLQKIAKAYAGKREELKAFLRGKHPAIVEPNKYTIMKPQINITKQLTEDELDALIDYIYKWQ